jgi:hypothetical protein
VKKQAAVRAVAGDNVTTEVCVACVTPATPMACVTSGVDHRRFTGVLTFRAGLAAGVTVRTTGVLLEYSPFPSKRSEG